MGFFIILILVILAIIGIQLLKYNLFYKLDEEYETATKKTSYEVYNDAGAYGEYKTYLILKDLPGYKKFLFNCYLPKPDGNTTEIDLIMLHTSGIYVFETKNYSGWIFGSENQQQWTQTIGKGYYGISKHRFLNPLIQNNVHIKELRRHIQSFYCALPIYSVIVFGDNCYLKNIQLNTNKHIITQHYNIYNILNDIISTTEGNVSETEINLIYSNLFPYTQTDEYTKYKHIHNIYC